MTQKSAPKTVRVAFVNTHPIQYFAPLYRYINTTGAIEAVPIYLSDHSLRGAVDKGFGHAVKWDIDLLSGMSPVFAKGAETRLVETGPTKMMVPEIWSLIRNGNYDAVVVHGHSTGANHIAWAAAKSIGIPIFTRGETHLGLERSASQSQLRDILMPRLYSIYNCMLAIGSLNRDFYRAMGVPDHKISLFPYSVDNERMIAASTMDLSEKTAVRAKLGLAPDRPAVLYCSKFQPRKYPDDLIRACARLVDEGLSLDLVMAGSGEMEGELKALASQFPKLNVIFPGFFNQNELPKLFGACDIFALPSRNEPWGLIINEAMCAALPIVASREIGSVADLLQEGINGHAFDAHDITGLVSALRPIVADKALCRKMGAASRSIISGWGYQQCLEGLVDALRKSNIVIPEFWINASDKTD